MSVNNAYDEQFAGPDDRTDSEIYTHELRQIIHVVSSYLDNGDLEGAEDVLAEVVESGAVDPQLIPLLERLQRLKGDLAEPVTHDRVVSEAPRILKPFSRPLPGADQLPRHVQRTLAETEQDALAGRLQAALDQTLATIAEVPDFLPLFVRVCELRLALDQVEAARDTLDLISVRLRLDDIHDDPYERGLRIALAPENRAALVSHARYLLEKRGAITLDPFVPAAIEASIPDDPDTASELARTYVELRPNDDEAVRVFLRAVVTSGDPDMMVRAFSEHVTERSKAPDLLYLRSVAASIDGDPSWTKWLSRAVQALEADPSTYSRVRLAIEESAAAAADDKRLLSSGLLAIAAADWHSANQDLHDWHALTEVQTVSVEEIALASRARAAALLNTDAGDPRDALETALDAVLQTIPGRDIKQLAETLGFDLDPDPVLGLYVDYVVESNQTGIGIATLQRLLQAYPDSLLIRSHLADLLVAEGRLNEGIRELRALAQHHERAGDYPAMVEAMRRISQAVPENIEIKKMLVDVYSRRGILDEALLELEALAELYLERAKTDDAVKSFTRAAEIACAIGDFNRGNELYGRGVEADPDNVPVRHAAVAFYLQTGAVNEAANHLRQIVRIALEQSDPDEAVAALHQIIGLAPQDAEAYHRLGEVLTAMGEYAQAERVYRRLAQIAPGDPVLAAKQSALAVLAATQ